MNDLEERKPTERKPTNYECWYRLAAALKMMEAAKPEERSELARRYAVSITEMEKVVAYFKVFVLDGQPE